MHGKIFWAGLKKCGTTSKSDNTLYGRLSSRKRWHRNHEWIARSMCADCITMSVSCSTRTSRLTLDHQSINKSHHKVEQCSKKLARRFSKIHLHKKNTHNVAAQEIRRVSASWAHFKMSTSLMIWPRWNVVHIGWTQHTFVPFSWACKETSSSVAEIHWDWSDCHRHGLRMEGSPTLTLCKKSIDVLDFLVIVEQAGSDFVPLRDSPRMAAGSDPSSQPCSIQRQRSSNFPSPITLHPTRHNSAIVHMCCSLKRMMPW